MPSGSCVSDASMWRWHAGHRQAGDDQPHSQPGRLPAGVLTCCQAVCTLSGMTSQKRAEAGILNVQVGSAMATLARVSQA